MDCPYTFLRAEYMPSTDLLIFDLDGTLTDTLDDLTDAVNAMRAEFELSPLTVADVRGMVGRGARHLVMQALPNLADAERDLGLRFFLEYNEAHIACKTVLFPGVRQTLAALRGQERVMVVLSNKNTNLCKKLLAQLEVEGHFAGIYGADAYPIMKPSPEPVFSLLRKYGADAGRTVIIGDSINDISAGKQAGICTVGCTYGYGGPDDLVEADYRVGTFAELLELPFLGN